ncbi:UNKNOWN [Stylonychia lemnae]|uniref:Amino acid transporter transmembrane domain-containing protein n=1 Tax=Stylonychia lemnae TaxID=5949 RepID=A0A077ZTM2_STYLE|nr:UNKNOWN [Stylonychia lemnae]|eukprot:CDW73263.1 UNKNOWN [Stylonychia lemnae]
MKEINRTTDQDLNQHEKTNLLEYTGDNQNSILGKDNINYSVVSPSSQQHKTTEIPQSPPQSPGQRLLYVAASPARYIKKQIRPGGIKSSIFSLIILCLGAGTLGMPYVFYKNGIVFGIVMLLVGTCLSMYTGWLVVICCHRLNASRYEDIALATYGKKASILTSICMLALGKIILYQRAYQQFKELLPYTLTKLVGPDHTLPDIISNTFLGETFWAILFSFGLVFPVSLARTLSALRFSSFFGFMISIYIVVAIVFLCLFSREITPDLGHSFKTSISNFDINGFGIFNSLPIVIFAYMYQTNIPMIYVELEKKDLKHMWKVMKIGTAGATTAYLFAGVFGYTAFADYPDVKDKMELQNVLKNYPNNPANFISLFGILIVVLFATPLTILPCKDTIEELFLKPGQKLNNKQNIIWTFILVTVSFFISLAIPNIGDAMTILGATTNSGIGFLLPIIYYLKLEKKAPRWASHKIVAYFVFVFICCSSVIELSMFAYKKATGNS